MDGLSILRTTNCGVLELNGISRYTNPADIVKDVARKLGDMEPKVAFLVFTGVTLARDPLHNAIVRTDDYGQKLQDYIEAHKLGSVTATPGVLNPVSGNDIRIWSWAPDWDALAKIKA